MTKYTISGIKHMIDLLTAHPQLLALSSLASIREVAKKAQEAVRKSGCGCSAGPVYAANRQVFERALDMMGHGDHLVVKSVMKVDQICFPTKDRTGNRVIKCI